MRLRCVVVLLAVAALASAGERPDRPGPTAGSDLDGVETTARYDMAVEAIVEPHGWLPPGDSVYPKAAVHNYGNTTAGFTATMVLSDPADTVVYCRTVSGLTLCPGMSDHVVFPVFELTTNEGKWTSCCSVYVAGDTFAGNDVATHDFVVFDWHPPPVGWHEVKSMPSGANPVKDGGWLAPGPEVDGFEVIYAGKGYKTNEFYKYHINGDSWGNVAGMPYASHAIWYKKPPRKGSVGCSDGARYIYVTQGNNTLGFYQLATDGDSWRQLTDVPPGSYRRKVKGGTDMAYVEVGGTGYVYLLKGHKTEFYRYNTLTGAWQTLEEAPTGARAKWDKGSWLCVEGRDAEVIYAHKAKYHELYKYYVTGDSWGPKMPGVPFVGSSGRRQKSTDGGSAAFYDGAIYALKGGNTQEWWRYTVEDSVWTELETMPSNGSSGKRKRVKSGGDVVSYGFGYFFALKGNRTLEFWRYSLPWGPDAVRGTRGAERGAASRVAPRASSVLSIAPSPLTGGVATLRVHGVEGQRVRVRAYDIAGRERLSLASSVGRQASSIPLDLRGLSAGVYLVRVTAGGFEATRKLIIQ